MKMNPIKFAELISYITNLSIGPKDSLTQHCIEEIAHIIDGGFSSEIPHSKDVVFMLQSMHNNRKIDAVKFCRQITGLPLKEAKDLVYFAMEPKPLDQD